MAESKTVARPYAQGIFQLARENDALAAWSEMLEFAAAVVANQDMRLLLGSPRLTTSQKTDLVVDVCGERLNEQAKNLLRLLAENGRLPLLPEIFDLYSKLRAEAERTIDATLTTALPVDDATREQLAASLTKRLDRRVNLRTTIDESLIGGAVVRAGDLVIDGSVKGKLERLTGALSR